MNKRSSNNGVSRSIGVSAVVLGSILFTGSPWVFSQSLPPGVTPAMMAELKAMSPEQQQALAKQYGISAPSAPTSSDSTRRLATPGEELPSPQTKYVAPQPDKTSEVKNKARSRYGRALFNRKVSTFAPTDDAPVPESYRLGVGDELVVQLFGKENQQLNLQLGRSGDINFPKLGSITLSGLTFEDARDLIKTRIAQQFIGIDAVVSMGRLRAINIFMSGEVSVPGTYSVSALTTVTQALFQAGGVTDIGSLRNIEIRRSGRIIERFDTYDLLMNGDVSRDIRLQSGDVIFVPPYTGVIDIEGQLKRPMVYELKGGETISDVLEMAGGFTRDAYPSQAILTRKSIDLGLSTAITVDLLDKNLLQVEVETGDTLRVPTKSSEISNSIVLRGAVTRSGAYGWVPGLRVSDLIQDARRDLNRDADLSFGLIVRIKNDVLDVEVLDFNLAAAIEGPGSRNDPELQEFDEVLVFSLSKDSASNVRAETGRQALLAPVLNRLAGQARQGEPIQIVSVSGGVRAPGSYPLITGASVGSLITAAGGLLDSAYLPAAELRSVQSLPSGELRIDLNEINLRDGSAENIKIVSRDHLTVRNIPDWSPTASVRIDGEVTFPGTYRIKEGERLSDVISRAGGVTDEAHLQAAIFTRASVADQENERANEFAQEIKNTFASRLLTEEQVDQGIGEISSIVSALQEVQGRGRLLIDLLAALSGDKTSDLEVTDGDTLIIPKLSKTIFVIGEIRRQGTHTYQRSLTVEDYIDLSAGFTKRADESDVYVIKANGSVVFDETSLFRFTNPQVTLQPGDTIVVPVDTAYKESLSSWREITQIIYQSVVSIAAVARL